MSICVCIFLLLRDYLSKQLLNYLQTLQSTMVAHDFYLSELRRFQSLEENHKDCAARIQSALDRASDNLKASKEVQTEFDEFVSKVQSMEAEMCEQAVAAATQQIMRTRVEMMLEYSRGE